MVRQKWKLCLALGLFVLDGCFRWYTESCGEVVPDLDGTSHSQGCAAYDALLFSRPGFTYTMELSRSLTIRMQAYDPLAQCQSGIYEFSGGRKDGAGKGLDGCQGEKLRPLLIRLVSEKLEKL